MFLGDYCLPSNGLIEREASSSSFSLVIIQFSFEFCILVLWPYALQRVKFSIGRNVLPEDGDSMFFRNVCS
jgi:hypothetical protein